METKLPANVAVLLPKLLREQETISDEQRIELWIEIQAGYCKHCGREEGKEKCQCFNDS